MVSSAPLDLSQLLASSNATDREAAWERLIANHTRLLLSVSRSMSGDSDDVMERYAFILEKLRENGFARLAKYDARSGARFSTWLTVTARNLCLDHHRAKFGRHRETADDSLIALRAIRRALNDPEVASVDADTLHSDAAPADDRVIQSFRDQCLSDAISSLVPREQLLLSLRFQDGLSAARIARIMGLPSPFHVYRALGSVQDRLKALLTSRGIDGSDG